MSTDSITSVSAATAVVGSRGELDHVHGESFSVHAWTLQDMSRSQTHHNNYDHVSYVTDGELLVYSADDEVRTISAGDSVYIPAGVDYSMETKHAKTVEMRFQ